MPNHRIKSSFKDPSGFLFTFEGSLYRQINKSYQNEFDKMIDSGLYQKLVEKEFERLFIIIEKKEIKDSERIIYYMQNKKMIN
mgnify:CR=1 FL=1